MKTTTAHWQLSEWISFAFHAVLVVIPLGIATTSQWHMWNALFGVEYWFMPWLLVSAVEIPALCMFAFYVFGVDSDFIWMRHFIPFISGIGLIYELHNMLQRNGEWQAWLVSLIVAAIIIYVAFGALSSIEKLFVTPDVATQRLSQRITSDMQRNLNDLTARISATHQALRGYEQAMQVLVNPSHVALPGPAQEIVQIGGERPVITENKSETVRIWLAAGRTPQELCAETGWDSGTINPLWSKAKKAQEGT